jgi:Na+/H+ antiporter NhaD/arsenite permease-like protein
LFRNFLVVLVGVLMSTTAWASGGSCDTLPGVGIGDLSLLWIIPFAGLLLSIAIVPMVAGHWWHHNKNQLLVAVGWASPVFVYLAYLGFTDSGKLGCQSLMGLQHSVIEYVSFIALLASLFIISGGILLKGDLQGKPHINLAFLAIGAVLANVIGTTGASMLLIQPLLRTNSERQHTWHIPIFFIFIVSNIGGALTPIGDPPLFLGYLRGIDFWWTLANLWWIWWPTVVLLLAMFWVLDTVLYRREDKAHRRDDIEHVEPLGVEGSINFLLLAGVIAAVLLLSPVNHKPSDGEDHSSLIPTELSLDSLGSTAAHAAEPDAHDVDAHAVADSAPATAEPESTAADHGNSEHNQHATTHERDANHAEAKPWSTDPRDYFLREIAMALLAGISLWLTSRRIRERNNFEFGPILEVAALFIGIFVAMIPATFMLQQHGGSLGITEPWQYFWATGGLSAFLDNAPTYVTFASVACGVDPTCISASDLSPLSVGESVPVLMAISLGAVFMGAGSYIGNGPNFMVRAIAEAYTMERRSVGEDGQEIVEIIKPYTMPSFFAYCGYAALFLGPVFILVSIVGLWLMI